MHCDMLKIQNGVAIVEKLNSLITLILKPTKATGDEAGLTT